MIASIIGGAFALLGFLIAGVIAVGCFAFWLWMLIHSITNKGLSDGEKIAWVLVIIFLPFIGSVLYFFLGRPKGRAAI